MFSKQDQIQGYDDALLAAIDAEEQRQEDHIEQIASENFMLAAEIDFQLGGSVPVYALDNPLNVKHGRAPQLAIWQRDEAALRRLHGGEPMLLAVDEKALRVHEREGWLQTLCGRIVQPAPLSRLDLFDGRRRIAFYAGAVPSSLPVAATTSEACPIWRRAVEAEQPR